MKFLSAVIAGALSLAAPAQAQIPGLKPRVVATADPVSPLWDPATEFGSNWHSYWSAKAGVATSGSNVTTWTATGSVGAVATAVATGPTTTTYNGLPAINFTGVTSERLSYPTTGLTAGAASVTLFTCAFGANNTNSKTAISIGSTSGGSSVVALRAQTITAGTIQQTTGFYAVASNLTSIAANTQIGWQNTYRILIGEFLPQSITRQTVDGDANLPIYPYASTNNISLSRGRIGTLPDDTSPWNGPLQCAGIITQNLTTLQCDKLSAWLAWEWGQTAALPDTNPYKNARPRIADTATSDLITGIGAGGPMEQKWIDPFTVFSSRRGGVYSGNTTGYNDPSAKGTWASSPLDYMTPTSGYPGFGQDFFANYNFNRTAIDNLYPVFGTVDIGPNGLRLYSTEQYPAVRASLTPLGAGPPLLSSLIATTQSTKISAPFARRTKFTVNSPYKPFTFAAAWSLGDRYNGSMPITSTIAAGSSVLTVTAVGTFPAGQSILPGTKLSGGGVTANRRVTAQLTGTGGAACPDVTCDGTTGTYQLNGTSVAATPTSAFWPHQEMDDMETFGTNFGNNAISQHNHILIDGVDEGNGVNLPMSASFAVQGGSEIEVVNVVTPQYIYYLTNGYITARQAWMTGSMPSTDRFHNILNVSAGLSWEQYPGRIFAQFNDGAGAAGTRMTAQQLTSGNTILVAGQSFTSPFSTLSGGDIMAFGTGGTTGTGSNGTYETTAPSQLRGGNFTGTAAYTITGITQANPGVATTSAPHNLQTGDLVNVVSANPSTYNRSNSSSTVVQATVISPTQFSYGLNTSALAAYVGSGVAQTPRLAITGSAGVADQFLPGDYVTATGSGVPLASISSQTSGSPGQDGIYLMTAPMSANAASLAGWVSIQMAANGTATGAMTYTPDMTVRSVELLAPPSNTSLVAGATPPTPSLTWAGCCANGEMASTQTGTVATISGAANYRLLDRLPGVTSGLSLSGTNVVASGLQPGQYDFYIEGCANDGATCNGSLTDGTPGAVKYSLLVRSTTTLNPADCSASGCGLSGGNLTLTNPNVSAWYGARTTNAVPSSAKVYMEFATSGIVGTVGIGVGTSSLNLNSPGLSGPGASVAYYWNDQAYDSAGVQFTSLMPTDNANGSIIGLAIDRTINRAWYRIGNGAWNIGIGGPQDPQSGLGGFDISTLANVYPFAIAYGGGVGNGLTANFGAAAFAYSPPAGFRAMP